MIDDREHHAPATGWERTFDRLVDAIRIGVPAALVIWALVYWIRKLVF